MIKEELHLPFRAQPRTRWLHQYRRSWYAHVILITTSICFLLPFLWMLSTSLKAPEQLFAWPPVWIPTPVVWSNYVQAVTIIPFALYLENTVIIAAWNVVGVVCSSALVAYGLARLRWPGRDAVFLVVLMTMMLPYEVTMIPLFMVFRTLGWIGTLKPLIVPAFFGVPFFIFLLRQFFMTIPFELSDAARIDGCSEFGIMWRVILPLAKPALATVALFTFMANWQDFLGPLIYLRDESQYTLSLGLQRFLSLHGAEWAQLMAASICMLLPIVVLFFMTQHTFIAGITFSGLKE